MKATHTWRTWADPISAMWGLEETPDLEAKMLCEHLLADAAAVGRVDAADHRLSSDESRSGHASMVQREGMFRAGEGIKAEPAA